MSEQAAAVAPAREAATAEPRPGLMLQRKCACGQHTPGGSECTECRKKRMMMQRWPAGRPRPDPSPRPGEAHTARGVDETSGIDLSRVPATTPALRTAPRLQRMAEDSAPGDPAAPAAEPAPALESAAPAPEPAPPAEESVPGSEPEAEPASEPGSPGDALLVEGGAGALQPGQMEKAEFLEQLQSAVCAEAEAALAGTGRSTEGCPYLAFWFGFYRGQSAGYVERALRRYVPEAAGAASAADYIPLVAARVRQGVERWAATGEVTGVPDDAPRPALPSTEAQPQPGAAAGAGSVQLKERDGETGVPADDPAAVQARLGTGEPLDGGVRARMEGAFGRSFTGVRMHTGATAGRLATEQRARAFTVGSHVAFGAGEYRPGTVVGDALIAHELAHTVQQGSGRASVERMDDASAGYGALEQDADRSAAGVVASLWGSAREGLADVAENAVPRLRSGLALQRCSNDSPSQAGPTAVPAAPAAAAPPPATTVMFQPFAACTAFDDSIAPPALMVPTGGTSQANAAIAPAADAGQVVFESADPTKATVAPATATATPQAVTVTGVAKGDTTVIAKRTGTAIPLATVAVNVKDRLNKTVEIHSVTETKNSPDLVPSNVPSAAGLQSYLNDTIWGKQANVFFTVTRSDKKVKYDLDLNKKLADPVLVSATSVEIDAISKKAKKAGVNFNIYFINEMEVPNAFTLSGRGETWIQSTHVNSSENVSAHELGHALGVGAESGDSKDVMYEVGDPSNPCEVRKRDWDAVNP